MNKAVFLDKDGTLIEDVAYNCDVSRIRLLPHAMEGLRRLHAAGYALIVVSNQAGIAHGLFSIEAIGHVEVRLRTLLTEGRIPLAGFYYCPHHPHGHVAAYAVACDCRKPAPGLLIQAASDCAVDLSRSWMIGDILHDVEAGRRAGCRTILIHNGHETEWRLHDARWPDYMAEDLDDAARMILAVEGGVAISKVDRQPRMQGAPYAS